MGISTDLANEILNLNAQVAKVTKLESDLAAAQAQVTTQAANIVAIQAQATTKDATIADLQAQIKKLQTPVTPPVVTPPPVVVAPPVVTPPVVVAPPVVTPPVVVAPSTPASLPLPVVNVPFTWNMPISGKAITFTPKQIIANQTFDNKQDSAVVLNSPHASDNTIYYKCNFIGTRYALWMDHQNNVVFIDCTYQDPYAQAAIEESTVRLEDCTNIYFLNPTIEAYGIKHAFRIHGHSSTIGVKGMKANSRGNGMMFGSYNGAALADHLVQELEMCDISLKTQGEDVFDPKRDGSLLLFKTKNFVVEWSAAKGGWDAPSDVKANPYKGWVIDLTSKQV